MFFFPADVIKHLIFYPLSFGHQYKDHFSPCETQILPHIFSFQRIQHHSKIHHIVEVEWV